MHNPEELAQEALKFLEIAQKSEEGKDVEKAISNYQKAAELLKSSGFLMHRIQEIYDRISELKEFIQQDKLYQRFQNKAQMEQLQDQAFSLLEGAKKLEFDGFFDDAIQQNLSAINLLVQAGWSETQLENIRTKINKLAQEAQQQKNIQKLEKQHVEVEQQIPSVLPDEKPQIVGMFGAKSSVEKAELIEKFRVQKNMKKIYKTKHFPI